MLLAVDVGNTQTAVGLFSGKELAASWRFATDVRNTGDEIAALLDALLRLDGFSRESVSGLAVASVVPRLSGEYSAMAGAKFGLEALVIGPGVKTGMPILTNDPRQVGPDLIVDAVAAFEAYGGPCIAVDFGTATTFSAVSAAGEYLGHAIAPGIEISLDALATRAARLLKIELADPGSVIGKNTVHAMQAGALYGFAGQVDGVVSRMRVELGGSAVTVATGGLAFRHLRSCVHARQARPAADAQGPGDHLPPEPFLGWAAWRPAAYRVRLEQPGGRLEHTGLGARLLGPVLHRPGPHPQPGGAGAHGRSHHLGLPAASQDARRRAGHHRDGERLRPAARQQAHGGLSTPCRGGAPGRRPALRRHARRHGSCRPAGPRAGSGAG